MSAAAAAFAYAATLAMVGFVLWLRDRRAETVTARIEAVESMAAEARAFAHEAKIGAAHLKAAHDETRAIVDNLQLRSGLTTKR